MRGLILTAKHHDGFCLWPSRFTAHSVKNSPWRAGRGDVVRELSDACREAGMKMGLYLSPWDRNHAAYGTPAYVEYSATSCRSCSRSTASCSNSGSTAPTAATAITAARARHAPSTGKPTTVSRHCGRWCAASSRAPSSSAMPGRIFAGWAMKAASLRTPAGRKIKPEGISVGEVDDLTRLGWGEADGTVWRPAEVDVSLRPGWFYHPEEHPRSLQELLDIYFASVGYGCDLLLNIPPTAAGSSRRRMWRVCASSVKRSMRSSPRMSLCTAPSPPATCAATTRISPPAT